MITQLVNYDLVESLNRLDRQGIYGDKLWVQYKDFCGQDIPKLAALLEALDA